MTNIPFGQIHFSLLLVTADNSIEMPYNVVQAAPKLTYLSFMAKTLAEDARKSIEAAKINGLTVIPLYKTE